MSLPLRQRCPSLSQAAMASGVVDVCLIPEVPFQVDGPHGVLKYIEEVVERKGHAVVCVAEGAGQDVIPSDAEVSRWAIRHVP